MHQKYLDEQRDKEELLAQMQEYMDSELQRNQEETDILKERLRLA
jgi:hypothetical protein